MNALRLGLLAAFLLCSTGTRPFARADEAGSEMPPRGTRQLVRESSGVIWGLVPYQRQNSGSYRFENGRWITVAVAGLPDNCRPLCLTQRADGAAVSVWDKGGDHRVFGVHHGVDSKAASSVALTASQSIDAQYQHLFADSKNNVWYTGLGPAICRLAPDGSAECLHLIQPEECLARGRPAPGDPSSSRWNTVSAAEDAQGRIWFYTDGEVYYSASLNGVLVYDGENFSSHEILLEGKPPRIYLLAPKDSGHFWAGTLEQGLCILDTATFVLERVSDQPALGLSAHAIFKRGEDWFFVSNSLWRLRADHWEKLLDRVDANPFARNRGEDRLWARAAGGNYLGSAGAAYGFCRMKARPGSLTGSKDSLSPARASSCPCQVVVVGWPWMTMARVGLELSTCTGRNGRDRKSAPELRACAGTSGARPPPPPLGRVPRERPNPGRMGRREVDLARTAP